MVIRGSDLSDVRAFPGQADGMSLREWYAGCALTGILSRHVEKIEADNDDDIEGNAILALDYADAMIGMLEAEENGRAAARREEAYLTAIIKKPELIQKILPDYFISDRNRAIYKRMKDCISAHGNIDVPLIADGLSRNDREFLDRLVTNARLLS